LVAKLVRILLINAPLAIRIKERFSYSTNVNAQTDTMKILEAFAKVNTILLDIKRLLLEM
jgi:hypothetical protein